jgi:gamma-glutamyl:cysteine ligase YbdK (ATP-grasp superfamily)
MLFRSRSEFIVPRLLLHHLFALRSSDLQTVHSSENAFSALRFGVDARYADTVSLEIVREFIELTCARFLRTDARGVRVTR